MSIQFNQISYQEVFFNFNNNVLKEGEGVGVKMTPIMRAVDNKEEVIALQLTVEFDVNNSTILKYAGIALFLAKGWKELVTDEAQFNEFKIQIWTQALGFFRGVVCEKVRGTIMDRFFIPQMPHKNIENIPLKYN